MENTNTIRLYTYNEAVHIYKKREARRKMRRKERIKKQIINMVKRNYMFIVLLVLCVGMKFLLGGNWYYIPMNCCLCALACLWKCWKLSLIEE